MEPSYVFQLMRIFPAPSLPGCHYSGKSTPCYPDFPTHGMCWVRSHQCTLTGCTIY